MSGSGQKKPSGRAGCIVGIVTVFLMLIGLVIIVWGSRSEERGALYVALGVAFFLLPILGTWIMTLIPQKARGVKEVPKKERVLQIMLVLSALMALGGCLGALAAAFTEKTVLIIVFGAISGVGFIGASIVSAVHTRMTGKNGVTIELFPTDPEQEKQDMEIAREAFGTIFKKEERLSEEERERELRRIDQQGGMTREQVEEYENRKRF